jgi:hypothetical protein
MSDYLWDKSGPRDEDVARLEELLARFRHRPRRRARFLPYAAAAILLLALPLLLLPRGPRERWEVTWLEGSGDTHLAVGDSLETDGRSRARIRVADIGRVDLDLNTRVRLVSTGSSGHRLDLRRGRLHALVHAPPRLFFVDTPAATAVDLGCAYALEVDENGAGLLRVDAGFVELEGRDGRSAYVPSGASCALVPGQGPGVPWFEGAPEGLLDPSGTGFGEALALSRPRDALTLWHLLARVEGEARAGVHDRLATLAPPPPEVSRDAVLRLDRAALLAWRATLPLP